MSKNILIFEDGKISRGSKAVLVRRGNKRVLITFKDDNDKTITEWFKLYIPDYIQGSKSHRKHNNKRKYASYCHNNTNQFYSDDRQTKEFKLELKEYLSDEYLKTLFE